MGVRGTVAWLLHGRHGRPWCVSPAARAAYLQLHLACPPAIAAARNAARSGIARVPDEVAAHMACVMEAPDPERHRFERPTLTLDPTIAFSQEHHQGIQGILGEAVGKAADSSTQLAQR